MEISLLRCLLGVCLLFASLRANGTRLTVTPFSDAEIHVSYLKANVGVSATSSDGPRAAGECVFQVFS
jgi:hypothetical protein